jgi:gliding motility-associated transport system permease protein
VGIVLRRELASYFATPLAYIFILIFLVLANSFTFYLGGFFERGQADLATFFNWHPWLYLFLSAAVSMRLWAEERNSGTIELLLTQPITLWQAVLGKFLAAWLFIAIALALTFPIWITVNFLGNPDNGAIFAAYVGSLLMAGGYLAIGSCMSALTRSQVIALILSVAVGLVFLLLGYPIVTEWASAVLPQAVANGLASLSFLTHFESIAKGVIDIRDILYSAMLIAFFLLATTVALDIKKAE